MSSMCSASASSDSKKKGLTKTDCDEVLVKVILGTFDSDVDGRVNKEDHEMSIMMMAAFFIFISNQASLKAVKQSQWDQMLTAASFYSPDQKQKLADKLKKPAKVSVKQNLENALLYYPELQQCPKFPVVFEWISLAEEPLGISLVDIDKHKSLLVLTDRSHDHLSRIYLSNFTKEHLAEIYIVSPAQGLRKNFSEMM